MVRTIRGIFRKMGNKEARQWIQDYVCDLRGKTDIDSISNFLSCTPIKSSKFDNLEQYCIKVFNDMEQEGTSFACVDMGQFSRF